jgi:hypothetical protein
MQRKIRSLYAYWMLAVFCLLLTPALTAQDEDGAEGVTFEYAKKTVINFDDDTIEGSLKTPDGQYLEVRKKIRHESLIRIRRHFKQAILGSFSNL